MTDNKDLKYNTPQTYEQFILEEQNLEQQDLYPELVYEDISEQRGYGPAFSSRGGKSIIRASIAGSLARQRREEERRREQGLCIRIDCQSLAEEDDLCALHKREGSEAIWMWKTAADTAASVFVPGYSVVKAVVRGVSGVTDELKSEAWDMGGTLASGSSKFGECLSTGVGVASSAIDWIKHQEHVDRGENYRSDCPVCRS